MSVHPSLEVSGGALDSFLPAFTTLSRPYNAYPVICSSVLLETIFATNFRPSPYVKFRRECIWTQDKGVIALDFVAGDDRCLSPKSPVLILVPGIGNGSGHSYIRHMVLTANKKGWRVVAVNGRGCGRSPVITPQFFGATLTGDLRDAIAHVSSRYPDANLYAAGWSLGANTLVKYLGEEGDRSVLSGAVSLCSPFNVTLTDEDLNKGLNKIYSKGLGTSLSKVVRRHAALFEEVEGYNLAVARNSKTLREFDDAFTRVCFGLKSTDELYQMFSSKDYIKHVCRPLLCIQAANDPIAPVRGIPYQDIEDNPNCMLIVTPKGGHLGWVAGDEAPFGAPWTDPVVMEFLEHLEKKNGSLPQNMRKVPPLLHSQM